ncbi:pre-mRNA splicing factor cwc24 [Microdochium trichocladiopsis]|uniref:Pre-mRNA-splicing factor CWC24 n=1 Tax=Microdochium trichocladiopsis TaxID=1682393 RepID=A0A9P9BH80_9PEZI|nr:pre-mRNA splicing factor cwc24 [Microdochium trichocladiopsis]KAH7018209.1 pre-mRNA splicing factor cwc24 [Microdochium trichocladiopsis]
MADTTDLPAAPVALFKKRGAKAKANIRKRPATPPPANSDSDDDYTSSEDEAGQRVKRRKKTAAVNASSRDNKPAAAHSSATVFEADRSVPITSTNDATKQSNWYDEDDAALLGKTRPLPGSSQTTKDSTGPQGPDGTYKGLANQAKYIAKNPDAPNRTVGPIKAATNIRTITVTDFAPDVCKDYKQTGFCGFGDNCKFLHAREAYQQGWQLDKEWEKVNRGKKNISGTVMASADRSAKTEDDGEDAAEAALLEKIPFACIICKGPYKEPIVTRCGHYFCLPCALQRYRKDPSCAACGAGTSGVFNTAKTLNKLLDKKRQREERLKAEADEDAPA